MPKPRPRTVNTDALPFDASPPSGLDDVAKAEWVRIVEIGMKSGLFTEADRPMVETYCEQYSLVRRLETEVSKSTPTVKTSQGVSENPVWRMHRQSKVLMLNMLKSLGCAPTSRQRVRPAVTSETAKASKYFD